MSAKEAQDSGLCVLVARFAGRTMERTRGFFSRCLDGASRSGTEGGGSSREADERKERYLKMITHQIQSPLNTIAAQLERIEKNLSGKTPFSPALMEDYFTRIKSSLKHLTDFVNDFVEVSHLEYGMLEYQPRPMDICAVANDVVGALRGEAEKREVSLSNRMERSDGRVLGDERYLRHALARLAAHALKSVQDGGEVWVEAEPRTAGGRPLLKVSVCDTGCGMDEEDRRTLGELFPQGDGGAGRQRRSGLGLFIVRVAVEAHKSCVRVEPLPGGGTKVSFDLFAAQP